MRLAVLSDIHGNLAALEEVLADLDGQGVDRILSLGDNVGYGPEPERVVRLLQDRAIPSVMGNHEWALRSPENLGWFNPTARRALLRTEELMTEESLAFCRALPTSVSLDGCRFVHGFPPDDVVTYLFQMNEDDRERAMRSLDEEICFVGHTHELVLVRIGEAGAEGRRLGQGVQSLQRGELWLVNAGSVGQPRDGNNRAKYVIWDSETRCLDIRFVAYDIGRTAEAIAAVGIPRVYANRLW